MDQKGRTSNSSVFQTVLDSQRTYRQSMIMLRPLQLSSKLVASQKILIPKICYEQT